MRGSRPDSSNLPAKRSTSDRPPLVDYAADFDIPKLWRDLDVRGVPQSIARPLTPGERSVVERRCVELELELEPFLPTEQDRAVAAMSRMLGGIRSLRYDDDEAAIAGLNGLRHVLAPFPLWAIEAGCDAISRDEAVLSGKKLDRRYPPNDSEVYAVIRDVVAPYRKALENAVALLSAPVGCSSGRSQP